MDATQTTAMNSALEAARRGDPSGLAGLPRELIVRSAVTGDVVPSLLALCASSTNAVISASWKCLVPVASDAACAAPTFRTVVEFMHSRLREALVGADWADVTVLKAARFFAAHLVTVLRTQPQRAAPIIATETIDLYLELHCAAEATSAADGGVRAHILPRLEAALAAMAAADDEEGAVRAAMLRRCAGGAAKLEPVFTGALRSSACFAAFLAILRDAHHFSPRAAVSPVLVLQLLLLWLPGAAAVLPCSAAPPPLPASGQPSDAGMLLRSVAALAVCLPDAVLCPSPAAPAEAPQGAVPTPSSTMWQWWQAVTRVLLAASATDGAAIAAMLVSALFAPSAVALERVQALIDFAIRRAVPAAAAALCGVLVSALLNGVAPLYNAQPCVRLAGGAMLRLLAARKGLLPRELINAQVRWALGQPVSGDVTSALTCAILATLTTEGTAALVDACIAHTVASVNAQRGSPRDRGNGAAFAGPPPSPRTEAEGGTCSTAAAAVGPALLWVADLLDAAPHLQQCVLRSASFTNHVAPYAASSGGSSSSSAENAPAPSPMTAAALLLLPSTAASRVSRRFMAAARALLLASAPPAQQLRFLRRSHEWSTDDVARQALIDLRSDCASALLHRGRAFAPALLCAEALHRATERRGSPQANLSRGAFEVLSACMAPGPARSAGAAPVLVSTRLETELRALASGAAKRKRGVEGDGGDAIAAMRSLTEHCSNVGALLASRGATLSGEEQRAALDAQMALTSLLRALGGAIGGAANPLRAPASAEVEVVDVDE